MSCGLCWNLMQNWMRWIKCYFMACWIWRADAILLNWQQWHWLMFELQVQLSMQQHLNNILDSNYMFIAIHDTFSSISVCIFYSCFFSRLDVIWKSGNLYKYIQVILMFWDFRQLKYLCNLSLSLHFNTEVTTLSKNRGFGKESVINVKAAIGLSLQIE